jgi:hypothetical protein
LPSKYPRQMFLSMIYLTVPYSSSLTWILCHVHRL